MPYATAWDGVPMAVLVMMLRTSNRHNGHKDAGWGGSEMDLADWMIERGKKPGDDLSEFFGG